MKTKNKKIYISLSLILMLSVVMFTGLNIKAKAETLTKNLAVGDTLSGAVLQIDLSSNTVAGSINGGSNISISLSSEKNININHDAGGNGYLLSISYDNSTIFNKDYGTGIYTLTLPAELGTISNINYSTSFTATKFNNIVKLQYTITTLTAPTVSIDNNGNVSWTAVPNATAYKYKLSDTDNEITTTDTYIEMHLINGQSASVKAICDTLNYTDSNYSITETFIITTLDIPQNVNISASGVVTWVDVPNAFEYVILIDGVEHPRAPSTSYTLDLGQTFQIKSCSVFNKYLDSAYTQPLKYLLKLSTPVLILGENGVITWTPDVNATAYLKYTIFKDKKYLPNSQVLEQLSIVPQLSQTVCIKALGDNITYADSDYSNSIIFECAPPLPQPILSISSSGLVSWAAVPNASGYNYYIGVNPIVFTTALSVQLLDGETINVKAVTSDETTYIDSLYSQRITYTANLLPKLTAPTLTISESGLATWQGVEGAVKYVYKINGGAEVTTTETSVQLSKFQVIQVKAVADSITYTDSEYSKYTNYYVETVTSEVAEIFKNNKTLTLILSGCLLLGILTLIFIPKKKKKFRKVK